MATWIKCSDRLPEKREAVWLTIKGHDVIHCMEGESLMEAIARISKIRWVTQGFLEEDGWCGQDGYPLMIMPIAWMPLERPEPYEGDA